MMKKGFLFLLSLMLLVFSIPASAEGLVRPVIESVQALLFNTDNVTIRGQAVFSLDGERFKTADILYMQDGYQSHWQLDLKTPRPYRTDQETGFTIIANGEKIVVMERYHPGTYSTGYDLPNNTVIRRSVQSERLVTLALESSDYLESLLGDSLALESDSAEGKTLRLVLSEESAPELLNTSLNLAVGFALHRFMGVDDDSRSVIDGVRFEDAPTITTGILDFTERFTVSNADIQLRLDSEGRPAAASGSASVLLSLYGGEEKRLDVTFDCAASDYGSTMVQVFNPDEFGVVPKNSANAAVPETDPALAEKMLPIVREGLAAAGYDPAGLPPASFSESDGFIYATFAGPDALTVTFNEEGCLLHLMDNSEKWFSSPAKECASDTLQEKTREALSAFLQQAFPDLAARYTRFTPVMEYAGEDAAYLYITASDPENEEENAVFVIREDPAVKIVCFDCLPE